MISEEYSWVIGPVIDAIAIVVGAVLIAWQVKRQFSLSRELQRSENRDELQLKLYSEINQVCTDTLSVSSRFGTYVRISTILLKDLTHSQTPEVVHKNINLTAKEFKELVSTFSENVIKLISIIESHEVVHKNLYIFRYAFGSALYPISTRGYELSVKLLQIFPYDLNDDPENKNLIHPPFPTLDMIDDNLELFASMETACLDIDSYLFDLRVSLQNILLGDLFSHKVPVRKPVDQTFKVIDLTCDKQVKELELHFQKNTEWGQSNPLTK